MSDRLPAAYPRTVAAEGTHELEIKKSRFLGTVARVGSEAEARAVLERVRKAHWDASHNCHAYIVGERGALQKASDDGEPAGTAGVPMLEVLRKRDLVDTIAVVSRWFGGVKLGAGGLVRAYGQTVSGTLDTVGVVELRPLALLTVRAPYDDAGRIEHALRASPHPPTAIDYGVEVAFTVALGPEQVAPFRDWLAALTGGAIPAEATGRAVVEVPVQVL